ncbi:MAG: T9SS type A sorting domain-containing protein [Lentimicrobiaceae bacterium]|nr:T9SS type A sorting domain-containing protein [Lentimicrobiaceae bacterium]
MKKRFLPISLLLTIIILAQTSFVVSANGDSGKYDPRSTSQTTAQSFMKSIRANQETGLIDPAWMLEATKNSQSRDGELNWTSLGPDNYGSLTRGIVYDNQDATNKTIYIGTMGGGVFKTTNGGITWASVSQNLMVSCMVQTEDGTIYIGTGDGRGAHNQNGLSELNYETSFVGTGIYKLGSETPVENTSSVAFVNDMAVYGNKVYAATNEGIMSIEGNTASNIKEGEAFGIEVCSDGELIAVIGSDVYMQDDNDEFVAITTGEENMLPAEDTYKIIAVSPSDHNYIYVAYLKNSSETGNIYYTSNHGETWETAYTATAMYDIFGSRGMLDNAMKVYPNDPRKVLIGGQNLWVMRDVFGEGIFRMECISSGAGFQIAQSGGAFYYNYQYIHYGIQEITFNPANVNEFFVGSEGGIFKGTCSAAAGYQFEGCNRYMINAENHTSVARMFSVGFAGDNNMTLGGSLDHGTINVFGDPTTNSITEGNAIYPNDIATTNAAETYGSFDYTKAGGPCAISTINPQIMFVTTTGSNAVGTPLMRTQTAGYDYDKENFAYSATEQSSSSTYKPAIVNTNAFRTPIALFENYNDTKAVEFAKYINRDTLAIPAGDKIQLRSHNSEYPFEYILEAPLAAGDSIEVQDIISSTMVVAVEGKVFMTRDALVFNEVARWWQIGSITGIPNALTISADGDIAYVGTIEGKLYKATGLTDAVTELAAIGQAEVPAVPGVDGTDSIPAVPAIPSVITFEEMDGTVFNGQAITSIAINPNDANEVIVTLGNYGNENYIFHATDGATFSAVTSPTQAPVYSSLIESTTGKVFVGTENGVYTSDDMNTWKPTAITGVPVMEIKQQLQANHDNAYVYLVDEIGDITTITYPGINNEGMIYIATYGRGLYRCDNYLVSGSELGIEEPTMSQSFEMNIFPNPIVSDATINFNVADKAQVTMQVYDLSGRMVMNQVLGTYGEGSHSANFNVNGLTSGTYIVRVQAGTVSNTTKILVY